MSLSITIRDNPDHSALGKVVEGYSAATATAADYAAMRQAIYDHRLIVLPQQADISPADFVALGKGLGTVVQYYEPMYAHPEQPEIFVSSNVPVEGKTVGVPKTGKFWHSDYQFRPQPFAFTVFSPKVLPEGNRGTFFIDMAQAFAALPKELQDKARATRASHSVRRFFKIRPEDVYRPLGEIIDEVEKNSPPVEHPTVVTHPVTGEEILYISEGFTDHLVHPDGTEDRELLRELLSAIGMLDDTFTHPNILTHQYQPGQIVIWDNRALSHRALHVVQNSAVVSHRVTVVDEYPLSADNSAATLPQTETTSPEAAASTDPATAAHKAGDQA